jgi:hypothetical protein
MQWKLMLIQRRTSEYNIYLEAVASSDRLPLFWEALWPAGTYRECFETDESVFLVGLAQSMRASSRYSCCLFWSTWQVQQITFA